MNRSYLFTLNDRQAIDAFRMGNKTKFINHSRTPNLVPKVVMVRGEHRIAFYACRDVERGEEVGRREPGARKCARSRAHAPPAAPVQLFFDYGYYSTKAGGERRRAREGVAWMKDPAWAGKVKPQGGGARKSK